MKHELQIHTKAVNAQMSDFYEVCSLIVALLIPLEPQTSDTQLSSLSYRLTLTTTLYKLDSHLCQAQ